MTPEEELELLMIMSQAEEPESPSGMFSRIMTGMGDIVYGGAQLLENTAEAVAPGLADTIQGWDESFYGATNGILGSPKGVDMDDRVNAREEVYRRESGIQEGEFDGARLAGNVISGLASLPLRAASLPALMAEGSLFNASMPTETKPGEGYWGGKAGDAAVGAAGGAGGKVLADVGGRWVDQYARPGLQKLREAGVSPTVGQSLGGAINQIEQAAASVPFLGSFFSAPRGRALDEWQLSVLDDVAATVDGTASKIGMDGIDEVGSLIDDAYDAAREAMPTMQVTPNFRSGMGDVMADVADLGMSESAQKQFNRIMADVVNPRIPFNPKQAELVGPSVVRNVDEVTSENLKHVESSLTKKINANGVDPQLRQALVSVRAFIREQAAGQSEEYGRLIKGADTAYAKFKRIVQASNGDVNDRFTPAQLNRSARSGRNASENQAARGNAMMVRDSREAHEVLGSTLPNSGSAERLASMALLTGGGAAINPAAGVAVPLLAAGSTRAGQDIANWAIKNLAAPTMKEGGSTIGKSAGLLLNEWMDD